MSEVNKEEVKAEGSLYEGKLPTEETQVEQPKEEVKVKPEVKQTLDGDDPFGGEGISDEKAEDDLVIEARHVEGSFANPVTPSKNAPKPFKARKVLNDSLPYQDIDQGAIFTLRGTSRSVMAALQAGMGDIQKDDQTEKWAEIIQYAAASSMYEADDLFDLTVRNGSMWVNMVNVAPGQGEENARYVGPISDPKGIDPRDKNNPVTRQRAMLSSIMGLGTPGYVPLWHTGIWVKIGVPTIAEFAALDETIVNEKIAYGNRSKGAIFSNDSAIYRKCLSDFVLNHIEWSTAPGGDDPDYLRSIIKSVDYDQLIWGMALARYPDGYPMVQPCTANIGKCNHIVEGDVDLRSLSWTDETRLSERQRRIMNNPRRRLSEEEFKVYQEEFTYERYNRVVLSKHPTDKDEDGYEVITSDGMVIYLDIPTLESEEAYNLQFINQLKSQSEYLFKERLKDEARSERVDMLVLRASFKTHGQWVKRVEVFKEGRVIANYTTDEEIDEVLSLLSGDYDYEVKFKEAVSKFVINSILTVIGLVNYECPNCGKKHDTMEGNHYLILPINVYHVFFTLVRCSVIQSFPKHM